MQKKVRALAAKDAPAANMLDRRKQRAHKEAITLADVGNELDHTLDLNNLLSLPWSNHAVGAVPSQIEWFFSAKSACSSISH